VEGFDSAPPDHLLPNFQPSEALIPKSFLFAVDGGFAVEILIDVEVPVESFCELYSLLP
jgi:hypothetical protein